MVVFGLLLLMIAPLLLLAALAVRFAGDRKAINSIDYATIVDARGYHRWAGNRLLVLPLAAAVFGLLSFDRPALGIIGCVAVFLLGICVWIWIATGSDRFRAPR